MTDEEIHNIYLHMSGKAEGLVEATGKADFPVLFARAILEYEVMTKDVQNMTSKSTYKEQLETKESGWRKRQIEQSELCSNYGGFCKKEWVGLTSEDIARLGIHTTDMYPEDFIRYIESTLREKNT
jgi:hypothetical protein